MRKFYGLVCVVLTTAFLSLCSMEDQSDAGLLKRLFRMQSYSSCGGGGGGLQSYGAYSSCGGGGGGLQYYGAYSSCGGGGGLQYAPAMTYYSAPSVQYAPASYSSGCPGGVCPPGVSGDGFSYYHGYSPVQYVRSSYNSIPAGIQLNPGERYVAGSLRQVQTAPAVQTASKPVQKPKSAVAEDSGRTVLYQITQKSCVKCIEDQEKAEKAGVDLVLLYLDDPADAAKIANLWRESPCELVGTPSYVLTVDGKARKFRDESADVSDFVTMAKTADRLSNLTPNSIAKASIQPTQEETEPASRIDRIEADVKNLKSDISEIRRILEQKVAVR